MYEISSGKILVKQAGVYRLDQYLGVSPTMSIDFSGNTMIVADVAVMDAATEASDGDLGGPGPYYLMPWNTWNPSTSVSPSTVPGDQDKTTHTIRQLAANTSIWGYLTYSSGSGSLWHQLSITRLD